MPAIARRDQVEEAERAHLATDPVCGMSVDPRPRKHRREHRGRTYWFCSGHCARKFEAAPEDYLAGERAQAEQGAQDAIYTCPMHPEIEQIGPGFCPIRGMALEPKTVTVEEGPSAEYLDMRRRFWVSAALSLPLLIWVMADHLLGLGHALSRPLAHWLQLALATPVVLWAGWPIFGRCWASLRNRSLNMWTRSGSASARPTATAWWRPSPGHFPGRIPRSRRARSRCTSRRQR